MPHPILRLLSPYHGQLPSSPYHADTRVQADIPAATKKYIHETILANARTAQSAIIGHIYCALERELRRRGIKSFDFDNESILADLLANISFDDVAELKRQLESARARLRKLRQPNGRGRADDQPTGRAGEPAAGDHVNGGASPHRSTNQSGERESSRLEAGDFNEGEDTAGEGTAGPSTESNS